MKKYILLFFIVFFSVCFGQSVQEQVIIKETELIKTYKFLFKIKQFSFLKKSLKLDEKSTSQDIKGEIKKRISALEKIEEKQKEYKEMMKTLEEFDPKNSFKKEEEKKSFLEKERGYIEKASKLLEKRNKKNIQKEKFLDKEISEIYDEFEQIFEEAKALEGEEGGGKEK